MSLTNTSYDTSSSLAAIAWGVTRKDVFVKNSFSQPTAAANGTSFGANIPQCVDISVYDLRLVESVCSKLFIGPGGTEDHLVDGAMWPAVIGPVGTNIAPRHGLLGLALHTRDPLLMLISIPSTGTVSSSSDVTEIPLGGEMNAYKSSSLSTATAMANNISRQSFNVTFLSLRNAHLCATSTVILDAASPLMKQDTMVDQVEVTYLSECGAICMCMRLHDTSYRSRGGSEYTLVYRLPLGISSQQGAIFSNIYTGPGFNFAPRLPLWRYLGKQIPYGPRSPKLPSLRGPMVCLRVKQE